LFQLVDLSVTSGPAGGIALCRPPGHHAGPTSSTGFCLVNNVALAARYALRRPEMCRAQVCFFVESVVYLKVRPNGVSQNQFIIIFQIQRVGDIHHFQTDLVVFRAMQVPSVDQESLDF
jgi:hypothetical protein